MTSTQPTDRFGAFGGRYVPETLIPALDELDAAYDAAAADPAFQANIAELHRDYVGIQLRQYLANALHGHTSVKTFALVDVICGDSELHC